MPHIIATVIDAADIRAYECMLPKSEAVSLIAARLADMIHLPTIGPDGRPMNYGLIPKGGALLDPDATLGELNLPSPLTMRLVPEISAGADDLLPSDCADDESLSEIVVGEPVALIHDTELGSRPDVRIDAEVHKHIEAFALANRNKECAGLLLGSVDSEGSGRIIHISAAVPAENAVGTRASVRIPLEAWEEMLRIRDFDYSDLRILGWFHTHAGWGVFMSDSDVFIHRHFFPHPNMVAYVLDPTTGRDGFFYWHEGKIGLCPSYGLVGNPQELKPRNKSRSKSSKSKPASGNIGLLESIRVAGIARLIDAKNAIIAALVLGVLYLVFAGSPFAKHRSVEPPAPKHVTNIEQTPAPKPAPVNTTAKVVETKKTHVAPTGHRTYAIKKNDNPWIICNRIYNDGELGPYLMRYNGMKPNPCLQVGQIIKLPHRDTLKKMARH